MFNHFHIFYLLQEVLLCLRLHPAHDILRDVWGVEVFSWPVDVALHSLVEVTLNKVKCLACWWTQHFMNSWKSSTK